MQMSAGIFLVLKKGEWERERARKKLSLRLCYAGLSFEVANIYKLFSVSLACQNEGKRGEKKNMLFEKFPTNTLTWFEAQRAAF